MIRVARVGDIPPGESRVFFVRGTEVAVFNVDGRFFAVDNLCPHQGGPLVAGSVKGTLLTCPWHFWQFRLETGDCAMNPSARVATYPVKIIDNEVRIEWNPPRLDDPL
jgi:nitrite reductase (NADH) small subunit